MTSAEKNEVRYLLLCDDFYTGMLAGARQRLGVLAPSEQKPETVGTWHYLLQAPGCCFAASMMPCISLV